MLPNPASDKDQPGVSVFNDRLSSRVTLLYQPFVSVRKRSWIVCPRYACTSSTANFQPSFCDPATSPINVVMPYPGPFSTYTSRGRASVLLRYVEVQYQNRRLCASAATTNGSVYAETSVPLNCR